MVHDTTVNEFGGRKQTNGLLVTGPVGLSSLKQKGGTIKRTVDSPRSRGHPTQNFYRNRPVVFQCLHDYRMPMEPLISSQTRGLRCLLLSHDPSGRKMDVPTTAEAEGPVRGGVRPTGR